MGEEPWNGALASPHLWPGVPVSHHGALAIRLRPPIKYRQQKWMGSRRNTGQGSLGSGRHFPIFLSPSSPASPERWVTLKWVNCPKDASPLGNWGWNLDLREGWIMWGEVNELCPPGLWESVQAHPTLVLTLGGPQVWEAPVLSALHIHCLKH